jgi:hypothetical protein
VAGGDIVFRLHAPPKADYSDSIKLEIFITFVFMTFVSTRVDSRNHGS